MPALPTFTARNAPEAPSPFTLDPAAIAAPAARQAASFANASEALAEVAKATKEAQQVTALANANTAWIQGVGELRGRIEMETDPTRIQSLWAEGTNAVRARVLEGVGDPQVAAAFNRSAMLSLARDQVEIVRLTARRTREAGEAALDANLSQLARAAATDPGRRRELDVQAEGAIAGAVSAGIIPANEAEKRRERYFGRLDEAQVGMVMLRNPSAALAMLSDPRQVPNIDPNRRVSLMNAATQAMNAAATRAEASERRAERTQRLAADRVANDLWSRIARARTGEGEMPTVADIQAQREWLSPGETRGLLDGIASTGPRQSNPETLRALIRQQDSMDPAQFEAAAGRAFVAREIDESTYRSLVSGNRSARNDDRPQSPAQIGRSYVRNSLDPGDVPMNQFMREALQTRQSRATADFEQWLAQNPTADMATARTQAEATVARYRSITAGEMRLSLPLPFQYQGQRNEITAETIRQAAQRLARTTGLSPADLVRETQALEAWQELLAPAAQPAPAAAPRSTTGATPGRGAGPQLGR